MSDISPQDDGGQGRGEAQDRAGDALKGEVQAIKDKAGDAAQTVKSEAAHFAETAKDKVVEQVDRNKETVTTAVGDFADAIRKAGEELAGKDQTMAAQLVSQAADGLQALSRTVSQQRPEEMLNTVRRFGRENPTAFLAGAVLAGVALGRFARSSATHDGAQATSSQPARSEVFPKPSSDPVGLGVMGDDEDLGLDDDEVDGRAPYRDPSLGAQS